MSNRKTKAEFIQEHSYKVRLKNDVWIELIKNLTMNEFKVLFIVLNRFNFINSLESEINKTEKFSRDDLNMLTLKRYSLSELYKMLENISKKVPYIKLAENRFFLESKEIEIELINREKIINEESDYTILTGFMVFQETKKIDLIIYFYLTRYEKVKTIFFNEKTLKNEFDIKTPFNRLNQEIFKRMKYFKKAYGIKEIKKIYEKNRIIKILISKK